MSCLECGKELESRKGSGPKPKYCNRSCQNTAWRKNNPDKVRGHIDNYLKKQRQLTQEKLKQLPQKHCIICGECIKPSAVSRGAIICSRACSIKQNTLIRTSEQKRKVKERIKAKDPDRMKDLAQNNRAMRKSRFRASVKRAEIFERDNYICQLCLEPIDMTATIPKHAKAECCETKCYKAPTVDHIIPLARGGWHEPENVQAAHFICNSIKADREDVPQIV
jgi:5-methylcytosine-specific restriction endonuclease McrA